MFHRAPLNLAQLKKHRPFGGADIYSERSATLGGLALAFTPFCLRVLHPPLCGALLWSEDSALRLGTGSMTRLQGAS